MSRSTENPLGKATAYPRGYSPQLLHAVPRSEARQSLRMGTSLPFHGEDLWNAWELSWLDVSGRPSAATAEIRVPAESPNIIESKSLKLYLNSLADSVYPAADAVRLRIAADLSACAGGEVSVQLGSVSDMGRYEIKALPGFCIDDADASFGLTSIDAGTLKSNRSELVSEELHSHLLRSNCPVTGQPDTGSILIRYSGPKIQRGSLLGYLVAFREHEAFHEACVEKIFVDLKRRCAPSRLTVYARYNRRGGIDINPFRSDFEAQAENLRLPRQ
ncbi:MAG: NADPH-dependent 7-cyano-7-deazaguanine reductase QueF [Gammaproteobacteria bacterium]|nr:NADPH-dependent 7-cyano-7-deazaguanine reductase QueF [Gammaproteobacteria bacterium]MDH4315906.1 NADPH-dependent 7-cyano-7-deazaguanine reductase QueF [Gammaproteobacteria bacterium]MDH5215600.1 NADPH-dependent 7-cyano-7-deazaguanine reductase QueF [Gammaproteobacteria bacterium]